MLKKSTRDFITQTMAIKNGFLSYACEGQAKMQVFKPVERTGWIVCVNASEKLIEAPSGESVVQKAAEAVRNVESSTTHMKGQIEDLSQKANSIGTPTRSGPSPRPPRNSRPPASRSPGAPMRSASSPRKPPTP